MSRTTVYTDGACSGNPGPGGWAWVVPDGPFGSGAEPATTNQRMELTAALEAIGNLGGPLDVVSDSTYVVNCFRDRWWEGWLQRGWLNSQRKPVANRDLWEPLVELYRLRDLRFIWVKGHGQDRWNVLADRLAVEAAATGKSRSDDRPPTEIAAADLPKPGRRDATRPQGHLVAVTGHRPSELGGYGDTLVARRLRDRLIEILRAKQTMHPDLTVVSGMGLGAEMAGAEAAHQAEVPYVAVLAFPDLDRKWPEATRQHFAGLVAAASGTVLLQKVVPGSPQGIVGAFSRRNAWMARNADEAIVVWDGVDEQIGRRVRSFQEALGEEEVWLLNPAELTR
jgi:ribonuclease HI/uncharacterized phage-like protein YoqJ